MEQTQRMEDVIRSIRKMPMYRQLIPLEAGVGWPIPLRRNKKVYITFPFFGQTYDQNTHQTILYPPFATITLDWSNQAPVEYINLRFRNLWPEGHWEERAGIFPHTAVANLSVGQYREQRKQLLALYGELMESLVRDEDLSPEWEASFSSLLRLLMEPALEPYYRVLGPKFFAHFLPSAATTPPSA